MKNEKKDVRIPKGDWGQFCWECYLRGFNIITGRMTEDGEVVVTSGVPKLRAQEFAKDIRLCNELQEEDRLRDKPWRIPGQPVPTVTAGEHGGMCDGDRLEPYAYHNGTRFRRVRAKRDCKQGELVSAKDVEVIETEEENGAATTDES